jgi:hypothetical protein
VLVVLRRNLKLVALIGDYGIGISRIITHKIEPADTT